MRARSHLIRRPDQRTSSGNKLHGPEDGLRVCLMQPTSSRSESWPISLKLKPPRWNKAMPNPSEAKLDDLIRRNRLLIAEAGFAARDTKWALRCISEQRMRMRVIRDLQAVCFAHRLARRLDRHRQ